MKLHLLRGKLFALALAVAAVANIEASERLRVLTRAQTTQQVEFDVFLPLTHKDELDRLLSDLQEFGGPLYHRWLTRDEFMQRFGPSQNAINQTKQVLARYGLRVVKVHSHGLRVAGQIANVERILTTKLYTGVSAKGRMRFVSQSQYALPQALTQLGARVADFTPQIRLSAEVRTMAPFNRYSSVGAYWCTDLRQAYEFPSYEVLTGRGVNIGILMASDYSEPDIDAYFSHEGLPTPTIIRHPVFGGAPFVPTSPASAEMELDLEQAGGMAPGATLHAYNIPDLSDAAVLAGYLSIVEDNVVDIANSSMGGVEALYSATYNGGQDYSGILQVFDEIFKQGNAQGITWVASSGDSGALAAPPLSYYTTQPQDIPAITGVYQRGIVFPASSPNVTAVGGTNLVTTYDPSSGTRDSAYVRENADGDPMQPNDPSAIGNLVAGGYWGSGGGVSMYFDRPEFQRLVKTGSKHRAIPDLAMHMGGCPPGAYTPCGGDRSSVVLSFAGEYFQAAGTSAASPSFAGLLALREELAPGRIGNVNYVIYRLAQQQFEHASPVKYFREGVRGFNGYYRTNPGYNKVLGNGTVYGKNFIDGPALPSAGEPGSPSNP